MVEDTTNLHTTILPALNSNDRAKDIFSILPPLEGLIKLRSLSKLAKEKSKSFKNVFANHKIEFNLSDNENAFKAFIFNSDLISFEDVFGNAIKFELTISLEDQDEVLLVKFLRLLYSELVDFKKLVF